MKLDITDHHFIELHKKGYTVDMVLILQWVNKGLSIEHILEGSKKIDAIYRTMLRKGLITEDYKLSQIGIEILDFISRKTNKKLVKPKVYKTEFDEWWDIYPTTDIFEYKGRKFQGTRTLRVGIEKCRLLFNKMILDGRYTKEQIIKATLYDIELRKKNSYRTGKNHLTWLQASTTYLNQATFDGFIKFAEAKSETSTNSNKLGSIDI